MFTFELIAVDLWGWLVPAVFIVIYLINHLLSAGKGAGQQPAGQQRRRPAGERPLRPQGAPEKGGQTQINTEIEQFLKRANQRRMEKGQREAVPARPKPKEPPKPLSQPLSEQAVDVIPLEHRDFDSVSASVQQHLGGHQFDERAGHLADDISQADENMERHLQQAFGHRLGSLSNSDPLASSTPVTDVQPMATDGRTATAKALAGLLANQDNIRQAIMLKEILERPVDRW
jgi:hypothetical protein